MATAIEISPFSACETGTAGGAIAPSRLLGHSPLFGQHLGFLLCLFVLIHAINHGKASAAVFFLPLQL